MPSVRDMIYRSSPPPQDAQEYNAGDLSFHYSFSLSLLCPRVYDKVANVLVPCHS